MTRHGTQSPRQPYCQPFDGARGVGPKYRYHVLKGEIQKRCRVLLVQICDAEDVRILKGVVSKDHIHMVLEYPPSLSVSDLVKRLKGRTSQTIAADRSPTAILRPTQLGMIPEPVLRK